MQAPTPSTPSIPSDVPRIITPQAPGTTAPAQVGIAEVPMEALQAQAAALARQLAGLRVQRSFLDRQLRDDGVNASAKAQIEANRANLDVQIAQNQADLENLRAQVAAHENLPLSRITMGGQVVQQVGRPRPNVDPEMVIGMSFALLMVVALPMSIAYARRVWRGKTQPSAPKLDEIAPRLDRLEHAVDAIAIEVERISEGQRFVTKILAERPQAAAPVAHRAESHRAEPHRAESLDSALPDARPILALGAGPIEPIRVADRQTVRQMNTPH